MQLFVFVRTATGDFFTLLKPLWNGQRLDLFRFVLFSYKSLFSETMKSHFLSLNAKTMQVQHLFRLFCSIRSLMLLLLYHFIFGTRFAQSSPGDPSVGFTWDLVL